ncbi:PAS domain S-box protein [Pseudarthrobacter sp. NBSH8]|uniref:PAS domain S-box protein n=1 Tax=Pseudarthrobacter sp. NBSH8 TaxID=2596911 RepID=UPI0021021579|nr:PAS domain S-box protein [Pseudarthrobacter sp. NBSH8]
MGGSRRRDEDVGAQNFGALLDASPDALITVNADGTIKMANAAASKLFGYTRHQLIGSDHGLLLSDGFRNTDCTGTVQSSPPRWQAHGWTTADPRSCWSRPGARDSLQGYLFSLPESGHRLELAGRQAEDALAALAARRPKTG